MTDHVAKKLSGMILASKGSKKPVTHEADTISLMAFLDEKYGKEMNAFCSGQEIKITAAQLRMRMQLVNPLCKKIDEALRKLLDTVGKKVEDLRAETSFSINRVSAPSNNNEENEEEKDEDEEDFDKNEENEEVNESAGGYGVLCRDP